MKRYYVRPIDNLGTLDGPPRDRTWAVMDRETGSEVAEHDRRKDARDEAKSLNEATP